MLRETQLERQPGGQPVSCSEVGYELKMYVYIVSCLTSVTVARSRAPFGARRKPQKKHDLVHEENQKKARFGARRKVKKKHGLVHEESTKKARFGARRKTEKSTTWCTKKTRKKHDLVHEENDKKARTRARFGV